MANESGKGAPGKPVNDSIDELLDGIPAEPMLPKKRARPIDHVAPASQNRRADDKVIVREGTDPRERARIHAESARRQSSTFGTSFLGPNATIQKVVVGVLMMFLVLGIYALVRSLKKNTTAQNMQNTSNSPAVTATNPPSSLPLNPEALPPVPSDVARADVAAAPSSSGVSPFRRQHVHPDNHAAANPVVQPAASTHSASFSGL